MWIEDLNIRILTYSDDRSHGITPENLDKSKIVIFRNRGKHSKNYKWWLSNNCSKVVNKYRYLCMTLTPMLSLERHCTEKNTTAKFWLYSKWSVFVSQKNITFSLFKAVMRSVLRG